MCLNAVAPIVKDHRTEKFNVSSAKLLAYQLPFKTPMRFKAYTLTYREGLVLQLTDQHGYLHHADIAPLPGFSNESLAEVTTEMIDLLKADINFLYQHQSLNNSVQFALNSIFSHAPESVQSQPTNNVDNIPLLQGESVAIITKYQSLGYPETVKLKVAKQSIEADIVNFQQLIELNPNIRIRCDANQAWSKQQAMHFFSSVDVQHIDYIEEPSNDHQTNLWLANHYQFKLGLDETLQQTGFCYRHHHCIKALIIKPSLMGSTSKIDQLVSIAQQYSLQVSFSSSFESIIGLLQIKQLSRRYLNNIANDSLFLGIDTLKYFDGSQLLSEVDIQKDCQQLECLWQSN